MTTGLLSMAGAGASLLALPTGALRRAPYGSVLAFDLLVIFAFAVPRSRRLMAGV